jgi:bifunctional DNase/RNase
MMLQVSVDSVRASLMSAQRLVVLKAQDEERYLPIWIGPFEADAIAMELQGMEVPRPMSHDLLKQVIALLGGRLSRVEIHDLRNDTFYARLILDHNDQEVAVDARPSDSIALAVRTQAPIFVEGSVMDKAGVIRQPDARAQGRKQVNDGSLDVFKEFLEELSLGGTPDDADEGEQ